ncbi:MAG: thioredoxin family protein [Bacteroidota bacterium]
MKFLAIVLFTFMIPAITWFGSYDAARTEAAKTHKLILVNFSGSDWCGPCIRMKKEVFESKEFNEYASGQIVLVRADFPRQKKNQPDKEQLKSNEALASKYNPQGKFPYTLLLDEKGKVLASWDGYKGETPEKFIAAIKRFGHGS